MIALNFNPLPFRNSNPGSHRGHSSRLPSTVHAFVFIVRRVRHLLPSSTSVDLCMHTLGPFYSQVLYKKKVLLAGARTHQLNLRSCEAQNR